MEKNEQERVVQCVSREELAQELENVHEFIGSKLTEYQNEVVLASISAIRKQHKPNSETVLMGETSDGYHTFNELYHHRAVLFSVIVRLYHSQAWKAKKHDDGTMFEGMFIVGMETPTGQATYHYDIEPYWDMFECRELDKAPKWDGHTPQQAVERLSTLRKSTSQSDPETGLMPCGCGGKAECCGNSGDYDSYSFECRKCEIGTLSFGTKEDAKNAWNRAMGWLLEANE